MTTRTRLLLMLLLLVLPLALIACDPDEEEDGDNNDTVEQVATDAANAADEAADDAEDAAEALATEAADAADDAGDAAEAMATEAADAVDDAGDAAEDAADDVEDAADDAADAMGDAVELDVPDVELPATYESAQEGLTVRVMHPEGWVGTDEGGSLLLANSQEALETADQPELNLAEGQEVISVILFPTMGAEMDPSALIAGMSAEMSAQEGMTVGEPENVSVNGREGVRVALNGENGSGEVYFLSYNTDYMLLAMAAAGDYDAFRDTALAIVNSVEVEVTETAPDAETEPGMEATEAAG